MMTGEHLAGVAIVFFLNETRDLTILRKHSRVPQVSSSLVYIGGCKVNTSADIHDTGVQRDSGTTRCLPADIPVHFRQQRPGANYAD